MTPVELAGLMADAAADVAAQGSAAVDQAAAVLARMTWAEAIGYVGVVLSIATSSMRTMIPLRMMGIVTNSVFLIYGLACGIIPTVLVNMVLLPLNTLRLAQMLRLVAQVKQASAAGDLSMDWLKPFMTKQAVRRGEVLFAKGDEAEAMFYTLQGRFRLRESGLELAAGQLVGELGLLAPDNRRTQTLECLEEGCVLALSYDEVRQLYFQNPEFGFYFLKLASGRLFQNLEALERAAAGPATRPLNPARIVGQPSVERSAPLSAAFQGA